MFLRIMVLGLAVLFVLGCNRSESPQPAAQAEPAPATLTNPEPLPRKPPGYTEETIDFKGVPLGMSGAWPKLQQLCLQESNQASACSVKDNQATFRISYGASKWVPTGLFDLGENGSVDRILLAGHDDYMLSLAEPLTDKLGRSFVDNSGSIPKLIWQDESGTIITLVPSDPSLGRSGLGTITFETAKWREKKESEGKAKSERAQKNM